MNEPERIAVDLADAQRSLLSHGLWEWGGPAACTVELAQAMGFADFNDLIDDGHRISAELQAKRALTAWDWSRALLATEIVFASDLVGSGTEWATTTGFTDEETIRLLRSVQAKLYRAGAVVQIGTRPPPRSSRSDSV